jgi:hypothetical protein
MERLWRPLNVRHEETDRDAAVEINEERLYARDPDGEIMLRTYGDALVLVVADEADCAVLPMTVADCRFVLGVLGKFVDARGGADVRGVSNSGGGDDRNVALGSGEAA